VPTPAVLSRECDPSDLVDALLADGIRAGQLLALVIDEAAGFAVAEADRSWVCRASSLDDSVTALGDVERRLSPRWIWWSASMTATPLVERELRVASCWDLAAVHRLLHGGSRADPATVWAGAAGLALAEVPEPTRDGRTFDAQLDLLAADLSHDSAPTPQTWPLRPDGHLHPGCFAEADGPVAVGTLAALAAQVQERQLEQLAAGYAERLADPERRTAFGDPRTTARSESAAALLCIELAHDGLPVDRLEAERLISAIIGRRPDGDAGRITERQRRDVVVLQHVPGLTADLRNPAQVKDLLRQVGIEVSDTRSWRLEPLRGVHPVVEPLLAWRKAERIETTYGYTWLDRDVGSDGRLRGSWAASDGAAGRMTAQAGLHNLPVELRGAVVAEPGHVFVRADLGQIEPRVLAAVSADPDLIEATQDDDLYLPVATRLGVERPVAKIAVLAAMYGQTSGAAGQALKQMERTYPRALAALQAAEASGRSGQPVTTYGGRHVPVWTLGPDVADLRAAEGGRGRFTRNALIQGAAAEIFKAWAATARLALRDNGSCIVLCLHDELLVQAPEPAAEESLDILRTTLEATGRLWFPGSHVRFVADLRILHRWSEAKD
jgi:DNA polymerase I